jgi:hypothetical protein
MQRSLQLGVSLPTVSTYLLLGPIQKSNYLMINVDATLFASSSSTGVGVVVRDFLGMLGQLS